MSPLVLIALSSPSRQRFELEQISRDDAEAVSFDCVVDEPAEEAASITTLAPASPGLSRGKLITTTLEEYRLFTTTCPHSSYALA